MRGGLQAIRANEAIGASLPSGFVAAGYRLASFALKVSELLAKLRG